MLSFSFKITGTPSQIHNTTISLFSFSPPHQDRRISRQANSPASARHSSNCG
ncbi:hypothetical protein Hanom_Chr09g00851781 [Helianthus anomalus]